MLKTNKQTEKQTKHERSKAQRCPGRSEPEFRQLSAMQADVSPGHPFPSCSAALPWDHFHQDLQLPLKSVAWQSVLLIDKVIFIHLINI